MMVTMATNDTDKNAVIAIFGHEDLGHNNEPVHHDNPVGLTFVICMLTVFSVVGVIGNAIVFYIFCGRRSTSTSVVFILALAGVDFFACLVAIPYTIVFEHVRYNLVYDGACKLYMFLITSIQPFSAYIMVGIALDRYFCICHPFLYVFTVPRAKAVVLCMAIPALIFGVITALSHGMYIYEVSILNENNTRIVINQFTDKGEAEEFVALRNITSEHPLITFIHYPQCVNNTYIFSRQFLNIYQKFHAMNFVLAYIVVAVLYILIYKSIFTRRVKKAKLKKSNLYPTSNNKTRDNNGEETQMTEINGCNSSNTKSLNNQTRKDAKYARKITLTARNDPSGFGQSEAVTKSLSGLSATGLLSQESVLIYPIQSDPLRNGSLNQSLPRLFRSNKTKRYAGSETKNTIYCVSPEKDTVYVGPVSYTNYTVYIGPEVDLKSTVYLRPMQHEGGGVSVGNRTFCEEKTRQEVGQEINTVYAGPDVMQERDTFTRDLMDCQDNDDVYTGPKRREENDAVYIGPQIVQVKDNVLSVPRVFHETDTVYTGPEAYLKNDAVYTGPQADRVDDNVYTAPQTCTDGNGVYIGPTSHTEDTGIYKFSTADNTASIAAIECQGKPATSSRHTDPWSGRDEKVLHEEQVSSKDSNPVSISPIPSRDGKKVLFRSASDIKELSPNKKMVPLKRVDDFSFRSEAVPINAGQSNNEFLNNSQKNYQDKYEVTYNGDDDSTIYGFCSDGALTEEKPQLESKLQCPENSQDCHNTKSPKVSPVSPHSHTPEEDQGNTDSSLKQTTIIDTQTGSLKRKRPGTFKDRNLMANIKTAFMLFIVTLVFITAYLPALLMANELVPFKLIGFYVYFVYNVANPFIYAFMNHTFREDLKKMVKVCKR